MAQSVVVKKEEKVNSIFEECGINCTLETFSEKFKEKYPNDWQRIISVYNRHERKDTKGKGHPMPKPDQYIKNMYNVGKNKILKKSQ